jgi:PAS domain S-box-containing protein
MEDDRGLARIMQKKLERKGFSVVIAANGEEGLEMLERGSFDAIVIDYNMPGLGGLDVIRELSSKGTLPPTIMLTGHGDEKIAVEAMKLGASDYIVKDFRMGYIDVLPMVINNVIKKTEMSATIEACDELYKKIVALSPVGISVQQDERLKFINKSGADILGASDPEDLIGRPFMDFVHPQSHVTMKERLKSGEISQGGMLWTKERFVRLDAKVIDTEVASVSFVLKGKPAVQLVFRDI